MNRIKLMLMCIYLFGIIVCIGCQQLPYVGETPVDYNDTCWISNEPNIWFDNTSDNLSQYLYGKAMTSDGEIDIVVAFDWFKPIIYIYTLKTDETKSEDDEAGIESPIGECMLSGTCEYSPEKCVVTVDYDQWYGEEYKTIVFKSQPIVDSVSEK